MHGESVAGESLLEISACGFNIVRRGSPDSVSNGDLVDPDFEECGTYVGDLL
jgi:hypothetical protein